MFLALRDFERQARDFAETRLRDYYGDGWWEQGVPQTVRDVCEDTRRKAESARLHNPFRRIRPPRSNTDYLDFSHLASIFTRDRNWTGVFEVTFGDRSHLDARLQELNEIRNDAFHHRTITETDLETVELYVSQFENLFASNARRGNRPSSATTEASGRATEGLP